MNRLLIIILFLATSFESFAQNDILIVKKRNKTIAKYWTGASIAFQLNDKEWRKGDIKRIQNDSIFFQPIVVKYYLMGTDTSRYAIQGYSLTDIYAIPKRGVLINYKDGRYQIILDGGHMHFYWIKSGFIFRVGAAGYAALHIINGLIKKNLAISTSKTPLTIAAAVFAGGVVLQKSYKLVHRVGKKYKVETQKFMLKENGSIH